MSRQRATEATPLDARPGAFIGRLRPLPAVVAGTVAVLVIAIAMAPFDDLARSVQALLLLIPVLVIGILGGRAVAVAIAGEAAFAFSFFLPPPGTPLVDPSTDLLELVLFAVVAAAMGILITNLVGSDRRLLESESARLDALQRADQERRTMLRAVSHDLRTPLATIHAAASELAGPIDYEAATRDELAELIVDEAERLDRIVRNLLDLSRIEAGALLPDRQPVDLGELIGASVARLGRLLSPVRPTITVEDHLPLVDVDYTQFDQVFTNILENAVRHSPPGGTVAIDVATRADLVVVTIDDEGDGIAEPVRERLFEPFTAATGSKTTGMGLAICKVVVDAHGGTIWAGDAPNGGARFTIELPSRARIDEGPSSAAADV
jgi:K+-sensing histidine kinase KdpD